MAKKLSREAYQKAQDILKGLEDELHSIKSDAKKGVQPTQEEASEWKKAEENRRAQYRSPEENRMNSFFNRLSRFNHYNKKK